jgi:hypothetical protein
MFTDRKLLLLIIFFIVVSITGYVLLVVIPTKIAERSYAGARQIGQDIANAFQVTPEITVNNTVVLQQKSAILELATLSQKFEHRYDWTNTWLGSTKKINISGTFEAKAGFDLNKKFSIQITDNKAVVILPSPQLLSVESQGDVKFADENGVWNWVDAMDRSKAMNAFTKDARRYAEQGGFIEQVKPEIEKKLKEILAAHEKDVEIRYASEQRINPL